MTNIKTYKSVLSLVLVFVLCIPAGIKVTHHLFVEHEHCHLHAHEHEDAAIDKEHKTCPICDFHFVEFFGDENPRLTGSLFALSDDHPAFIQQEISTEFLFLYNLRGPPLHS